MTIIESRTLKIALVGHPNTGKSTLFNSLTGGKATTANYPGVTVEPMIGRLASSNGTDQQLIDLPGVYTLNASSIDEATTIDFLTGKVDADGRPDLVIVVLDAENLERGLFLGTQVLDLELPTIFVINKADRARAEGIKIDKGILANRLGLPVLVVSAASGEGIDEIKNLLQQPGMISKATPFVAIPEAIMAEVEKLHRLLHDTSIDKNNVFRSLVNVKGEMERRLSERGGDAYQRELSGARARLAEGGMPVATIEPKLRYAAIRPLLEEAVDEPGESLAPVTDRLDNVLLNPYLGFPIFAFLMYIAFQAIYTWAGPLMDFIDFTFGSVGSFVANTLSEGPLQSLIVDGIIGGIGGVIIFLPQIMILFLFIGLLEQCGYMARAAFLMDKVLNRVGLSGRSFIPMLSSYACAIPGVMAARTIENKNDRFTTMMIAPLMSCSARLPVYIIMIGAFIPEATALGGLFGLQGLVLFIMHFVGLAVAIPVALLFKKTIFKSKTPALMMELPAYRIPNVGIVLRRMVEKGLDFVKGAGTIILAVTVIIWALAYFPRASEEDLNPQLVAQVEASQEALDKWLSQDSTPASETAMLNAEGEFEEGMTLLQSRDAAITTLENHRSSRQLEQSILGRMGKIVEPVVLPMGWDWRIAIGAIASFPAREVIVATLGVIFQVGDEADEESVDLRDKLQSATWPDGRPLFNIPVALSIMVFFALCAQCAATLAVIAKETRSWKWPIFTFSYMTILAYIAGILVYQVGMLFV